MFRKFAVMSILLAMIFSCAGSATNTAPIATGGWEYKIEIILPGTKSEGRIGHLFFNGREIPYVFDTMIIAGKEYNHVNPQYIWGFGGYVLDETPHEIMCYPSPETITDKELGTGWYFSRCENGKKGTPLEWIWVNREAIAAIVDPGRLDEFIQKMNLSPIKGIRDLAP